MTRKPEEEDAHWLDVPDALRDQRNLNAELRAEVNRLRGALEELTRVKVQNEKTGQRLIVYGSRARDYALSVLSAPTRLPKSESDESHHIQTSGKHPL